jgi:hypothetical protein
MKFEEHIEYMGWPDCLRLSNEEIEIIVASVIGPRILRLGFIGKQNFFYLSPRDKGRTGGVNWRIYGGHRLWHAPEAVPRSYGPDNHPVACAYQQQKLTITQEKERSTGIIKEMEISLSPDKNQLTVLHRLINGNLWDIQLSPWAISALAAGGRAIVPQEPYGEGDEYLLPARSLALWSYTRMDDPRWIWGSAYIQARQDPSLPSEQKIGVMNKQGWMAYCLEDEVLLKRFTIDPAATYPDLGSNCEIYINGEFLEIETLGPLLHIPPGGMTEHIEYWLLDKGAPGEAESSIGQALFPKLRSFQGKEGGP